MRVLHGHAAGPPLWAKMAGARRPAVPVPMRSRSPSTLCLLAALATGALAAQPAAEPPPDPRAPGVAADQRLTLLVERMRQVQEGIQTLEAAFVQRKESDMLLAPEVARGGFSYAAPDRVRWEYAVPNPISIVIEGGSMTTWYRDLAQAERFDVGRQSQRVLEYLGAGSSLATLLEYFDVVLHTPQRSDAPFELELTPRFERLARRLESMRLWVDPELYLPVRLHYVEPGGDTTDYAFSEFRVNQGIPEARFRLELPDEVAVRTIDLNRRGGL